VTADFGIVTGHSGHRDRSPFRVFVTDRFGDVTGHFGIVTAHFGDRDRRR